MKKFNFFILLFWMVLVVLLVVISKTAKAEEFAKYRRDFEISKSSMINIRTKSVGYLKYKLKKGTYQIDIYEITSSTVMLDDGMETGEIRYDPILIESYHYKFIIDSKRSITLKQGYKTSDKTAKFKIKIKKIGD